jgi:hypothetical protein
MRAKEVTRIMRIGEWNDALPAEAVAAQGSK